MLRRYEAEYVLFPTGLEPNGCLIVNDTSGQIVAAGARDVLQSEYQDVPVTLWPNRLLMPGTINVHAHAFQHLARGRGVDRPFLTWRDEALYRLTPHLDPETLYLGSQLAFLEMLQAGVTTVAEFFYLHGDGLASDRAVIQAARDVGIRLVLARTFYDWNGAPTAYRETIDQAVQRTQTLAAEVADDPQVIIHIAPHSLHGASDAMIREAHALARELQVPCHIHVAEEPFEVDEVRSRTGHTPVAHLAELGVLGPNTIAVHLVCLTDGDIDLVAETGTRWAYCPSSNLFLADGIAPLRQLLARQVVAGLGTDGGCSNNRANLFEEMRMAALVHKGVSRDATVLGHDRVLEMGTIGGSELLQLPTGRLEPGFYADFIGIDLTHPSLIPWTESTLAANVVYAMQPDAVRDVVVAGRPVVRDGVHRAIDNTQLNRQVQALVNGWSP
ncbi:amidohydrolase family protein [Sulfobacillus harzensis]|uniref:Amidohydrolase n=1 Tax=Sulfobacillus harzensis TaxID=2729629 RepID=A0A7Y0L741_9FIRM|nr:amidohydrolase [Sulfobacillus harzensis]